MRKALVEQIPEGTEVTAISEQWEPVSRQEYYDVCDDLERREICYNGCTNDELRRLYGAANIKHVRGEGYYRKAGAQRLAGTA